MALLATVLLTSLLVGPVASQGEHAPHVSRITSILAPPFNYYSVEANDPDGDPLSFSWTLTDAGPCGAFFTSSGNTSEWRHDDEEACPHDAAEHPGTITVVVTDGSYEVTRVYTGGTAPYQPPSHEDWDDPSYSPPGGTTTATGEGGSQTSDGDGTSDDPRDTPRPEIYGEELECGATDVKGALQPVQAVYQDDPDFVDKPGKRLVVHGPTSLTAELDMVAQKPTVVSGIKADRWQKIHYEGKVLGIVEVPVEVHITLKDSAGEQVVYRHDAGMARIRGDCIGDTGFDVDIPTPTGVPEGSFLIAPGPYTLTMDLVETVTGYKVPGTSVTVAGQATEMPDHRVYFAAAFLSRYTAAEAQELVTKARNVAAVYATDVPDFFPLAPGQASTVTRPIEHDLFDELRAVNKLCLDDFIESREVWGCEANLLRAKVENQMRAGGWQMGTEAGSGQGAPSRVVLMIPSVNMTTFGHKDAIAFAPGTKGVFVGEDGDHWDVAHEIVHTLPRHLWSKDEMVALCAKDYHNTGNLGTGIQVTQSGGNQHEAHLRKPGLMGAVSLSKDYWIEQCTYWHLLSALKERADPPLFMVRGIVLDGAAGQGALFEPGFTLDGVPDLTTQDQGAYALVLQDAAGDALARYPFDLTFHDDEERNLSAVSFGFGVPRVDGTAALVLEGPSGTLATQPVSRTTPTVQITAPADGLEVDTAPASLRLAWDASDADGDNLTFTVVASPDDGQSWYDIAVDLTDTALTVDQAFLAGQGDKLLRVTASDGVWSAVDEVRLDGPEPPSDREGGEGGDGPVPEPSGTPGLGAGIVVLALGALALAGRRRR